MATFRYMIRKDRRKADGTWSVVIRFSHNQRTTYLSTSMHAAKSDLTSAYKIRNAQIIDKCEDLVRIYRKRCMELELELHDVPFDRLVAYITRKEDSPSPDFMAYARQWLGEATMKGKKNYQSALNAFAKFMRDYSDMPCCYFSDVTGKALMAFEKSLNDKPRAQSLYTNAIVRIFNEGRDYYNDEEHGVILVRHSLRQYHAPKQKAASRKRALSVEQIRQIFALPYGGKMVRGATSRRDLALDCFRLSFALMGMNAVDMYHASRIEDNTIIYNRSKTKDRRNDGAEMRAEIPAQIAGLVRKYRGEKGHVFNFSERFSTPTEFNRTLNIGLKEVGREIGEDCLQFYAARHSMATIAVNDCRISKYLVNDMLCHVDAGLKITELYIKKDFTPINEANRLLMDYVLGRVQHVMPETPRPKARRKSNTK